MVAFYFSRAFFFLGGGWVVRVFYTKFKGSFVKMYKVKNDLTEKKFSL